MPPQEPYQSIKQALKRKMFMTSKAAYKMVLGIGQESHPMGM
jgi:hypothetical protein